MRQAGTTCIVNRNRNAMNDCSPEGQKKGSVKGVGRGGWVLEQDKVVAAIAKWSHLAAVLHSSRHLFAERARQTNKRCAGREGRD